MATATESALSHSSSLPSFASKVTAEHLKADAALYIRQSTSHQLRQHQESTDRQYGLTSRLHLFGFHGRQIIVIDDDLGVSGSGRSERPGFQRLLTMITQRQIKLVMGLEMSRLARNSRDWHDLFELCAVYDCLIADEDGVFDPNDPNDRLVLGLKGIISELELHTMQVRLERGRLNKAQRGALFHDLPVGYIKNEAGLPEFDPDESARHAMKMFFELFNELQSSHKLFCHLAAHQLKLPFRQQNDEIDWRVPAKTTVYEILKHPLYAGAYGYGRRKNYKQNTAEKTGQKHLPPDQWKVLLRDVLPAYISWSQYQRNQETLQQNNTRASDRRGPARGGSALLSGMIRCGHCNRRMSVSYNKSGTATYLCGRHHTIAQARSCQNSIANVQLDKLISDRVLEVLAPSNIELSVRVIEDERTRREQLDKLYEQRAKKAEYDVELASRRYRQVDPANRLVAQTLECQWEAALQELENVTAALEEFRTLQPIQLGESERNEMISAASDIVDLWQTKATREQRQQIVRLLISHLEVTVRDNRNQVGVCIHWQGGFESCHEIQRPVVRFEQMECFEEMIERISELALAGHRSPAIAQSLASEGFVSPRTRKPITSAMVQKLMTENQQLRKQLNDPELKKFHWFAADLASRLGIPTKRLKDWVTRGWVTAVQRPFGRTWVIFADEDELQRLEQLVCNQSGQGRPAPAKELRTPKQITR